MEQSGQMSHNQRFTRGNPGRTRNQRRMDEFNVNKNSRLPQTNWSDEVEEHEYRPLNPPKMGQPRQTNRSRQWKDKQVQPPKPKPIPVKDPAEVKIVKAKAEVLKDEPMWQYGPYTGTQPVQRVYAQNLDFSTFPALVERTYDEMQALDPRLRRDMPFCSFAHVSNGVLNATIIDHVRNVNLEDRFANEDSPMNMIPDDFVIPEAIAEYCKLITPAVTLEGDTVRVNVANAGIPQPRIEADEEQNIPAQPSGGFGPVDAANHNAYECYNSPLVTARLVEATVQQNADHRFGPWAPLPEDMFPVGAQATQNLLGYRPDVERLTIDGLNALQGIAFPNEDNMASRLKWSPELAARVSGTCTRLKDRFKMHTGKITVGSNPAPTGWIEVPVIDGGAANEAGSRLNIVSGAVKSSTALGASQCNLIGLMGLKRKRTAHAAGFCYVNAQGGAIAGWNNTRNANFDMIVPFAPLIGIDLPSLRVELHRNSGSAGSRLTDLSSWLRRHFLIDKRS